MADMYERAAVDRHLMLASQGEVLRPAFLLAIHHHHIGKKRPGTP